MMHPETIIAIAFSITNIFRLFAYLPQIVLLIGERETPAVSVATWAIFLASNAVTALYAAIVVVDLTMSHIIFGKYDLLRVYFGLVLWKRWRSRNFRLANCPQ